MSTKVSEYLANLTPEAIPADPKIKGRFVSLFNDIHGKRGEAVYEHEKYTFVKLLSENKSLSDCSKLSLYGAFLDMAVNGLSLDPAKKLCYLVPFKGRCKLMISPYGELTLRKRSGQISQADNPVLVYEGDTFEVEHTEESTKIRHVERPDARGEDPKITAGYIRLYRPDGTKDVKILWRKQFDALKKYALTNNPVLYNECDPGFYMAKVIKHAFKAYPAVRIGNFTEVEPETSHDQPVSYDIDDDIKLESDAARAGAAEAEPAFKTRDDIEEVEVVEEAANGTAENSVNSQPEATAAKPEPDIF